MNEMQFVFFRAHILCSSPIGYMWWLSYENSKQWMMDRSSSVSHLKSEEWTAKLRVKEKESRLCGRWFWSIPTTEGSGSPKLKTLVDTEHIEHRIAAWTKIQMVAYFRSRLGWGKKAGRLQDFEARQLLVALKYFKIPL